MKKSLTITKEEFHALFDEYFDDVRAFLYMYARSEAQLKDWVQDVFIALWEKRSQIDFNHPFFKSYLLKTARNHALKKLQKQKRYNLWLEENLKRLIDIHMPESQVKISSQPDFKIAYSDVLRKIPDRARETWIMSREEGLSYPEIAQIMGVSVKTVESQISKVLKILREELGDIK